MSETLMIRKALPDEIQRRIEELFRNTYGIRPGWRNHEWSVSPSPTQIFAAVNVLFVRENSPESGTDIFSRVVVLQIAGGEVRWIANHEAAGAYLYEAIEDDGTLWIYSEDEFGSLWRCALPDGTSVSGRLFGAAPLPVICDDGVRGDSGFVEIRQRVACRSPLLVKTVVEQALTGVKMHPNTARPRLDLPPLRTDRERDEFAEQLRQVAAAASRILPARPKDLALKHTATYAEEALRLISAGDYSTTSPVRLPGVVAVVKEAAGTIPDLNRILG